ncbi:MAG: rhomboid family intramembrane serine protease [Dehalococcoidia bacterium]|nr:rhomboid family intramembrane serine protease [Dehalococcoidia bacterium]
MIPVSDSPRARSLPFVNVALIAACVAVFIYELTLSEIDINRFFFDYGVIPRQLSGWADHPSGLDEPSTVITSAFIHGGWLHLIGNMLYLWVFGDNVEDALGHIPYLLFYLIAAAAAAALQVAVDSHSGVPMVGASGAIAGVLGAYLVLYPSARVGVLIPWLWFFGVFRVPAVALIVFWFVLQLFSGLAAIGAATGASEGIAVWAHVGGFLAGFLIVLALRPLIPRRSPSARGRRSAIGGRGSGCR